MTQMKAKKITPREANTLAFEWISLHARHAPDCDKSTKRIIADGAHRSGLGKDYGGRYMTDEERDRLVDCTCGLDDVQAALCQASER